MGGWQLQRKGTLECVWVATMSGAMPQHGGGTWQCLLTDDMGVLEGAALHTARGCLRTWHRQGDALQGDVRGALGGQRHWHSGSWMWVACTSKEH
jgi:hypothetical protein